MKKVLLFLLYVLLSCNGFGQNLKWDGEFKHMGAFPAAECPRDNYGNFCAVVDVILPFENFEIECDMVVRSEKLVGRYRCYVCVPTQECDFTIYTDGHYPLSIPFSSRIIAGGEVYQVVVYREELTDVAVEKGITQNSRNNKEAKEHKTTKPQKDKKKCGRSRYMY